MRNIKNYSNFKLNESTEIENEKFINDVFLEFTDDEFKLELEPVFFDKELYKSEHSTNVYNQPGLVMVLKKRIKSDIQVDNTIGLLEILDECVNRLSDLGKVVINTIRLERTTIEFRIFLIYEDKKVELSTKEGFYDFFEQMQYIWRNHNNKTTRSFNIQSAKDEVILTPKSEDIDVNRMLPEVRNQLKKFFDPWYQSYKSRTSHEWVYDVKVIDNKIHVIYKEAFRLNRMGQRI